MAIQSMEVRGQVEGGSCSRRWSMTLICTNNASSTTTCVDNLATTSSISDLLRAANNTSCWRIRTQAAITRRPSRESTCCRPDRQATLMHAHFRESSLLLAMTMRSSNGKKAESGCCFRSMAQMKTLGSQAAINLKKRSSHECLEKNISKARLMTLDVPPHLHGIVLQATTWSAACAGLCIHVTILAKLQTFMKPHHCPECKSLSLQDC